MSMDEVFSRIIGDGLAGGFSGMIGQGPARMLGNAVVSQARPGLNDALVGHVADGFPSGLAPNQSAVVLYVLPSGATPVVVMELNDETGVPLVTHQRRRPPATEFVGMATGHRNVRPQSTDRYGNDGETDINRELLQHSVTRSC